MRSLLVLSLTLLAGLVPACGHNHNKTSSGEHAVDVSFALKGRSALGLAGSLTPGEALSVTGYSVKFTCLGVGPDGTSYPTDSGAGYVSPVITATAPFTSANSPLVPVGFSQCTSLLTSVTISDSSLNSITYAYDNSLTADPSGAFAAFNANGYGNQFNYMLTSATPMGGASNNPWVLSYEFEVTETATAGTSTVNTGGSDTSVSVSATAEQLPNITSPTYLGLTMNTNSANASDNGIQITGLNNGGANNLATTNTSPCGSDTFFVYAAPGVSIGGPAIPTTPYVTSSQSGYSTQTSVAVFSAANVDSITIPNTASLATDIVNNCSQGSEPSNPLTYYIYAAVGCANPTTDAASFYWVTMPFNLSVTSGQFPNGSNCPLQP